MPSQGAYGKNTVACVRFLHSRGDMCAGHLSCAQLYRRIRNPLPTRDSFFCLKLPLISRYQLILSVVSYTHAYCVMHMADMGACSYHLCRLTVASPHNLGRPVSVPNERIFMDCSEGCKEVNSYQ
jgi:hypothetical protein